MAPDTESSSKAESISKLEQRDKVGDAGELVGTFAGVAGGTAAAGTLAAAAGVTTIPVLTHAAGWLGIAVFSATPVGWIAGVGLAGGLVAYAINKMVRSGGRQDQIREDMVSRLRTNLKAPPIVLDAKGLYSALDDALKQGLIDKAKADRVILAVVSGKLNAELAISRVQAILQPHGQA